jgi:hypothetical protein
MTLISFMIFSEGNKKTKKPKEKLQPVRKEKERGPNNHVTMVEDLSRR